MEKCTLIYHITHINNLSSILRDKFLWSDAERINRGYTPTNIAYEHIKQRRFTTPVPIGVGGTLANYVPFYFCKRSPMLCAIYKGGVTGTTETQQNIIYLISSAEKVIAQNQRPWCFTDGHAIEKLTLFYNNQAQLTNIDWKLIEDWHWNNTPADNDRIRRKQAEFLAYESFPLEWVDKIGVFGQEQKMAVESILAKDSHSIPISIEKKWYYSTRG